MTTRKNYTTVPTENLRTLCIENDWFTCGTIEQYEKLFYANENNASFDEIVTIIWLCSDDTVRRVDIKHTLFEARYNFINKIQP